MTRVMMACGHTSNYTERLRDGTTRPACVICGCFTVDDAFTGIPEDKQEFDEKRSFRKSEGWESIGHISRDGLHVEILYMEVRN